MLNVWYTVRNWFLRVLWRVMADPTRYATEADYAHKWNRSMRGKLYRLIHKILTGAK